MSDQETNTTEATEQQKQPKVTTKTVTVTIKDHPRNLFYQGKQSRDHLLGIMQYMATKPATPDPKPLDALLRKMRQGDVVGIGFSAYTVESVDVENRSVTGKNMYTKTTETINESVLQLQHGAGFCEILYRNGKPYGIKTKKKVKLNILDYSEDQNTESTEPSTSTP